MTRLLLNLLIAVVLSPLAAGTLAPKVIALSFAASFFGGAVEESGESIADYISEHIKSRPIEYLEAWLSNKELSRKLSKKLQKLSGNEKKEIATFLKKCQLSKFPIDCPDRPIANNQNLYSRLKKRLGLNNDGISSLTPFLLDCYNDIGAEQSLEELLNFKSFDDVLKDWFGTTDIPVSLKEILKYVYDDVYCLNIEALSRGERSVVNLINIMIRQQNSHLVEYMDKKFELIMAQNNAYLHNNANYPKRGVNEDDDDYLKRKWAYNYEHFQKIRQRDPFFNIIPEECPSCHSNDNIHRSGDRFQCAYCGHTWYMIANSDDNEVKAYIEEYTQAIKAQYRIQDEKFEEIKHQIKDLSEQAVSTALIDYQLEGLKHENLQQQKDFKEFFNEYRNGTIKELRGEFTTVKKLSAGIEARIIRQSAVNKEILTIVTSIDGRTDDIYQTVRNLSVTVENKTEDIKKMLESISARLYGIQSLDFALSDIGELLGDNSDKLDKVLNLLNEFVEHRAEIKAIKATCPCCLKEADFREVAPESNIYACPHCHFATSTVPIPNECDIPIFISGDLPSGSINNILKPQDEKKEIESPLSKIIIEIDDNTANRFNSEKTVRMPPKVKLKDHYHLILRKRGRTKFDVAHSVFSSNQPIDHIPVEKKTLGKNIK